MKREQPAAEVIRQLGMVQNNCSATVVANCLLEHEEHSYTHMLAGEAWVYEVIGIA